MIWQEITNYRKTRVSNQSKFSNTKLATMAKLALEALLHENQIPVTNVTPVSIEPGTSTIWI